MHVTVCGTFYSKLMIVCMVIVQFVLACQMNLIIVGPRSAASKLKKKKKVRSFCNVICNIRHVLHKNTE